MTPTLPRICQNCHGVPGTRPALSEFSDPFFEGPLREERCASSHLADWTQFTERYQNTPNARLEEPWWVRAQFENARQSALPFRIRVRNAELRAELRPRSSDEMPLSNLFGDSAPDDFWFSLGANAQSSLEFFLNVQDDELLLRDQTLMRSSEVLLDGIGGWNFEDPSLRIDEDGMIHFEADMPWLWWRNSHIDAVLNADPRPQFAEFNYLGWLFNALQYLGVPGTEAMEPIPVGESIGFEAVLTGLAEFFRDRPAPEPNTSPILPRILRHLRPGTHISSNLMQIADLFVPGILDLGESQLEISADYQANGHLRMEISQLNAQLDPMAWGNEANPSMVQLTGGWVRSSNQQSTILDFDPSSGRLQVDAPLQAHLEMRLPQLGAVVIDGRVRVRAELEFGDSGVQLVPGTSRFELIDGSVQLADSADTREASGALSSLLGWITGTPWGELGPEQNFLSRLNFEINDGPHVASVLNIEIDGETQRAWNALLCAQIGERSFEVIAALPVSMTLESAYDFSQLLSRAEIVSRVNLSDTIRELDLRIQRQVDADTITWNATASAEQIEIDTLRVNGTRGIQLNELNIAVALQIENPEGESYTIYRVPNLDVSANPHGAEHGLIRGPIRFEQLGERPIEIQVDRTAQHLELRNGRIAFRVHRADLIPEAFQRYLDPTVQTLGVDGQLRANFEWNFPDNIQDWNGHGLVRLVGDHRGDLYWFDRHGRRTGPPILRNTQWQWRRVNRINTRRGYALGNFMLHLLVNSRALSHFSEIPTPSASIQRVGRHGEALGPTEFTISMNYDNQPSPRGFRNRIIDYLNTLYRQQQHISGDSESRGSE